DWGRRACRATGVSEETQQRAAEAELDGLLEALEAQLARTPYALGSRPTAVDAVLLGALRAHFLNDPTPSARYGKLERVRAWALRTHAWDGTGELPPFPETTPFGQRALEVVAQQYRPFVLANARALAAGDKAFTATTYGEEVSYRTRPYPERSRQMVRGRVAHRLDSAERREVDAWLQAHGLAEVFGAGTAS
ncbi:MAG: glutathione S-transferase family protein, partial [Myxococcota bacterium]